MRNKKEQSTSSKTRQKTSRPKKIKVIELFAGVGGFRLGLERASTEDFRFETIWNNQWEPGRKDQFASKVYVERFGEKGHSNRDISKIKTSEIPDFDMLVGGFPCQDYSVAKTLNQSKGLEGKKGVLWWDIYRIVSEKKKRPPYLLLENVDRLLKSPAIQRGRDFAIMLASLSDLGYCVEWRVINAAEYGMPQRRRRVFILAYHSSTKLFKEKVKRTDPIEWVSNSGVLAKAFPLTRKNDSLVFPFALEGTLDVLTEEFNDKGGESLFENAGIVINRNVYTFSSLPNYVGPNVTLGDIILRNGKVSPEYYIPNKELRKWKYLKGAKNEVRVNKEHGFTYQYNEGAMAFPDSLDRPARTIITGEGGSSASRFKHVVQTDDGRFRRLMPLELERLNMFPDNHTAGISDVKRAFLMGNALVVGVVEKIGHSLINFL